MCPLLREECAVIYTFVVRMPPRGLQAAPNWVLDSMKGMELPLHPSSNPINAYIVTIEHLMGVLSQQRMVDDMAVEWWRTGSRLQPGALVSLSPGHCEPAQTDAAWVIRLEYGALTTEGFVCDECFGESGIQHRCLGGDLELGCDCRNVVCSQLRAAV